MIEKLMIEILGEHISGMLLVICGVSCLFILLPYFFQRMNELFDKNKK